MYRIALVPSLLSLLFAVGCGSSAGSGGFAGVPCAQDGTCPSGMACGGQYCVYIDNDATQDTGGGAQDTGGGGQDTGGGSQDTGGGSQDTGGGSQDTGVGGNTMAIAGLQQGTASKVCSKTDGQSTTLSDVTLEVGVSTAPIAKLGNLRVFYVRPEGANANSGVYQGIKVVVFGEGALDVKLGDRVKVRGDLVEYYCETEITTAPEKVEILGQAALEPVPFLVQTADIAAESASTEPYEGVYVKLDNVGIAAANVNGTDGKPHGTFAVAPKGATGPVVHVAPTAGTTFTKKDESSGDTITIFDGTETFSEIRGHITYSFGTYQLRPTADSDLIP
ncbi:MAG: hypothetical protein RIT45_299 [Pseudomonadota bacterium]